ncbi:MAG: hypothetical protein LJE97_07890 [Betaproteobacteria bacterium]|jgi:hypothetical protein|nr:hypothetical protein [Betaproteobacteria bacterium]
MISRRAAVKACAHALFGVGIAIAATGVPAADPAVIELTQVPCQFLEPEGGTNHGFQSSGKKDCVAINAETEAARLAKAKTIRLRPGKYIFRVTNLNVDYELGFWLRGDGLLDRLSLPSVSGGGLKAGTTQDYEILLEEGEYVYSCPLNPTPAYKLVVK